MIYAVVFSPEVFEQLRALRDYISRASTAHIADRYVDSIISFCEGLGHFPHAGVARDEVRPGLRTSAFKKRVVVAYVVADETQNVTVLGVFYGGQDFESLIAAAD